LNKESMEPRTANPISDLFIEGITRKAKVPTYQNAKDDLKP